MDYNDRKRSWANRKERIKALRGEPKQREVAVKPKEKLTRQDKLRRLRREIRQDQD